MLNGSSVARLSRTWSAGYRRRAQGRLTNWAHSARSSSWISAYSDDQLGAFYVDGLGFHVDWEHQFEPGFPVFAQLTRDGLSWFLTEHTGDCQVGGAAYFVVDDVDALHRDITARGIKPAEPPEDTPWQTREMNVIDPDGNRLRFANPGAR
jgi:uncharacterized glyoxalase superfamily protein PhnB